MCAHIASNDDDDKDDNWKKQKDALLASRRPYRRIEKRAGSPQALFDDLGDREARASSDEREKNLV